MTSMSRTLDPIRPNNGEVGDDMQSGVMDSVQGQEEIVENGKDVAENRVEAED